MTKERNEPKDKIIEKIKKIYANYGIDTSDMEEDEFLRLKKKYEKRPKSDLDNDLKESEKYSGSLEIVP